MNDTKLCWFPKKFKLRYPPYRTLFLSDLLSIILSTCAQRFPSFFFELRRRGLSAPPNYFDASSRFTCTACLSNWRSWSWRLQNRCPRWGVFIQPVGISPGSNLYIKLPTFSPYNILCYCQSFHLESNFLHNFNIIPVN